MPRSLRLVAAALIALASRAAGEIDDATLAQNFSDFQDWQAEQWSERANHARSAVGAAYRPQHHEVRVARGHVNSTNLPVFQADIAGRRDDLDTMLGLTDAHAVSTGAGVIVAVLDCGFNLHHPEIEDRILSYGFDPVDHDYDPQDTGNGLDDDNDGVVDGGVGHGTFVIGMVLQVAPEAKILPVRVADDEGHGLDEDVASGIDFAIAMGARVINLSYESGTLSHALCVKIADAHAAGITVVVSAGNDASTEVNDLADDGVTVSVGSTNWNDVIASFSNTPTNGAGLSLFAPGVDLYGPHGGPTDDADCYWSGTSFSAGLVSGAAALALGTDNTLTPTQVRDRLLDASTVTVHTSTGSTYSYAGRIDVLALVDP